jgi:hypothetical protein
MQFPLGFQELSLWLAISSTILLATSEFLSPYYSRMGWTIKYRRLRTVALALGVLFLSTVAIRIYPIIITI